MCCTYCKHEKASRDRSEDNNVVSRTYPSLSFSRLAIDLVKPVKQVSIEWVFPGGRLIGWKVATNSVLYLKQKATRFIISPCHPGSFFERTKIQIPSYRALVQASTRGLSHHHWCVPRPAKQPGKKHQEISFKPLMTGALYYIPYVIV